MSTKNGPRLWKHVPGHPCDLWTFNVGAFHLEAHEDGRWVVTMDHDIAPVFADGEAKSLHEAQRAARDALIRVCANVTMDALKVPV